MPVQPSPHRRSFLRTTILASSASIVLLSLIGMSFYPFQWNAGHRLLPVWGVWLVVIPVVAGLALLGAYAALVAVGGIVVLYRDLCEERGLPYVPVRPRERIRGPILLAFRRFLSPRARLLPGELAEVRSLPEILATLDERGCLEGLPFMPEMVAYCGHRFPVHRRVDKVWEYAHVTGLRRFHDAVLLKTLRCDGQSHGGCQSGCQLIWKEAWLRPAGTEGARASGSPRQLDLAAHTQIMVEGKPRYVCQMTEIERASSHKLRSWNLGHYWRDLITGNIRPTSILVALGIRLFNGAQWRLRGPLWPVIRPTDSDASPHQELGLQPGQLVRVKSKHAIESTLNRKLRNRGLEFGQDMLFCCGGSYRVRARAHRIVHEGTGELLVLKTPSILLEDANANGGNILTPQNEFFFWREIWLEPQPAAETSPAIGPPSLERPTHNLVRPSDWLPPRP
jgi:hypothetical protein